ncbi:MAG: LPXTG cell wall anchor domain-containing protein, partial [Parafannyhessea umbonata]
GAGYTVTEEAASGYESSSENAIGTIEYQKTAEVTFTNTLRTLTLPLTGESGLGATYAIGATLLAFAAGYLHVRRVAAGKGGDGRD